MTHSKARFAGAAVGLVLGFLLPALAQEVGQQISGFKIPDYDEQMKLSSMLFGDHAEIMPSGSVEIRNLKLEYYEDEAVAMRITAPNCTYDRRKNRARSDGRIRISRDDMVVTGEDFEFDVKNENFLVKKNAKVVLRNLGRTKQSGEPSP